MGLKPPVPTPMMIKPMRKQARDPLLLARTVGTAEMVRMMWPMIAIHREIQIAV